MTRKVGDCVSSLNEVLKKRLRVLMAEADIKPEQLSEKSGVNVYSIRQYLRGEATPGLESAYKLAVALGCTVNDLCAFPQKTA